MKIFGKKKPDIDQDQPVGQAPAVAELSKSVEKTEKPKAVVAKKSDHKTAKVLQGAASAKSYSVLLKPLITEKAADLGAINKYVFAINPTMNKIEVKKAVRLIYKVDPISVNILNRAGRNVRYGRISGKTKKWKKAIVTLKAGDSIKVYEGV